MKLSSPVVSIVVVVRNDADGLDRTLRSIERQQADLGMVETVVVDGASTDGTAVVAERSTVPDLIISEPDAGIYDAMNKGAARSSGTWLHFLNAGDLFASEDALSRVLRGLRQTDAAARDWFVAGAAYVGGKVDGQRIANVPHRRWAHSHGLQPHCHQATWFRRRTFLALGGHSLQHSFAGDFDLIFRFGLAGLPCQDRGVVIAYLEGGVSARRAAEVPRLLREVRRERLGLMGSRRLVDDAVDLGVRGLTRIRRGGWWLRAAMLYIPKRVSRRARAALASPS